MASQCSAVRATRPKIALAALVAFSRAHDLPLIDCQQDTSHLASLGGQLMPRDAFCAHVRTALLHPSPRWKFEPVYWQQLLFDDGRRA